MTDKLQQTIKEEISKTTPDLQSAISSIDWVKITEDIGKKNSLTDIEINNLQVETLLVIIGTENLSAYPKNIENQISLTTEEAGSISKEIEEKIFQPLIKKLTENVKKSVEGKTTPWNQTVDFIISNGNYMALLERPKEEVDTPIIKPVFSISDEHLKSNDKL